MHGLTCGFLRAETWCRVSPCLLVSDKNQTISPVRLVLGRQLLSHCPAYLTVAMAGLLWGVALLIATFDDRHPGTVILVLPFEEGAQGFPACAAFFVIDQEFGVVLSEFLLLFCFFHHFAMPNVPERQKTKSPTL